MPSENNEQGAAIFPKNFKNTFNPSGISMDKITNKIANSMETNGGLSSMSLHKPE